MLGWVLMAWMRLSGPALAADFNGDWILDAAASESNDPLLAALGVGWMPRQFAKRLAVRQEIHDLGDRVTIDVHTSLRNSHYDLKVDGVTRSEEPEVGRHALASHRRVGKDVLLSTVAITFNDGSTATMNIRRELVDAGRSMAQITTLLRPGEPPLTVLRVFRLDVTAE